MLARSIQGESRNRCRQHLRPATISGSGNLTSGLLASPRLARITHLHYLACLDASVELRNQPSTFLRYYSAARVESSYQWWLLSLFGVSSACSCSSLKVLCHGSPDSCSCGFFAQSSEKSQAADGHAFILRILQLKSFVLTNQTFSILHSGRPEMVSGTRSKWRTICGIALESSMMLMCFPIQVREP